MIRIRFKEAIVAASDLSPQQHNIHKRTFDDNWCISGGSWRCADIEVPQPLVAPRGLSRLTLLAHSSRPQCFQLYQVNIYAVGAWVYLSHTNVFSSNVKFVSETPCSSVWQTRDPVTYFSHAWSHSGIDPGTLFLERVMCRPAENRQSSRLLAHCREERWDGTTQARNYHKKVNGWIIDHVLSLELGKRECLTRS